MPRYVNVAIVSLYRYNYKLMETPDRHLRILSSEPEIPNTPPRNLAELRQQHGGLIPRHILAELLLQSLPDEQDITGPQLHVPAQNGEQDPGT